jgi:glutamate--cysteine ligase catalytic subunit
VQDKYNDLDLVYDQESYDSLKANGIDEKLAKHVAHLFIRDPLVIYEEKVDMDDTNETDHFENIQSTNWQTVGMLCVL